MSWFDECPLTKEDFEILLAYLLVLSDLSPTVLAAERLQELIQKLKKWVLEEEQGDEKE